tara:strand:+ start:2344 stop:2868 length:525 start_codon:yes stop_codon:yes gene_type:complete
MESKENIVFLGMMGSGKTTIGKLVSKRLNLNFFDTDQNIEDEQNMKISKIFKEKGESFFRELEEKTTLNILKKKNTVIAIGGGAFLNKNIREKVLTNSLSIWLKWKDEILLERIKKSFKRPLAVNSSKKELLNMIKKRSGIYSKALYNIDCNKLTKDQLVNEIVNIYEANKVNS